MDHFFIYRRSKDVFENKKDTKNELGYFQDYDGSFVNEFFPELR